MTSPPGSTAVVIPTRNGAPFIGETLRSVADQRRPADDVVVVDDGSTDATAAIVARHAFARMVRSSGRGSNAARATGLAATDSDYVAFLDHDDVWAPHHLETLCAALDGAAHPVAFSRARAFTTSFDPEPAGAATGRLFDPWRSFPVNFVGGPSAVVVRRSALDRIGGWPAWDRVPTDVYMWFRLADLGPFVWWPSVTTGWRRHEGSMSSQLHAHDPVDYGLGALRLLHEALELHLPDAATDARFLADRLDELSDLMAVVAAMCRGRADELPAVLHRVAGRRRLSSDIAWSTRTALLNATRRGSTTRRNVWHTYASWPRAHRDVRRVLVDPVLASTVVAGVRAAPRDPSRWGVPLDRESRAALAPLAAAVARAGWRRVHRRGRAARVETAISSHRPGA